MFLEPLASRRKSTQTYVCIYAREDIYLLAINAKGKGTNRVPGRTEESFKCDPGSELRLLYCCCRKGGKNNRKCVCMAREQRPRRNDMYLRHVYVLYIIYVRATALGLERRRVQTIGRWRYQHRPMTQPGLLWGRRIECIVAMLLLNAESIGTLFSRYVWLCPSRELL